MDLNAIKARLEKLTQDNNSNDDYRKHFWNAPMGKTTIRIVPSLYSPDDIATELVFHNKLSRYPILTLTNFHKQDPVEEFREKLRELGGKDNWSLNGKLTPSSRYMIPVIVRGEEDKGVRIWSVGISIYKALIRLAADDEIGDFTDVANGYDVKVEKVAGNPYPETTIDLARKSSPLSSDANLVEKWLKEQPEPVKCFMEPSYEYIKKQLESYLRGDVVAPVVKGTDTKIDFEKPGATETQPFETKPVTTKPVYKDVKKEFDDIFGSPAEPSEGYVDDLDELLK